MGFAMKKRFHSVRLIFAVQIFACTTPEVQESIVETEQKLVQNIGNWQTFDSILASIEAETDQDLVLLHLSVDHPKHAKDFCARVSLPSTKETCRRILENPHLNMPK